MEYGWCDMSIEEWSGTTTDDWAALTLCGASTFSDSAGLGTDAPGYFKDYPFIASVAVGDRSPDSVLYSSGRFIFSRRWAVPSIAGFTWSFGINYLQGSGVNSVLGQDFNYPQNVYILAPVSVAFLELMTGESTTTQQFIGVTPTSRPNRWYKPDEKNRSRAYCASVLTASSDYEITLISHDGTRTFFRTFDPSVNDEYRIHAIEDRYGNRQTYQWKSISTGASLKAALDEVTDPYGRKATYIYYPSGTDESGLLRQVTDPIGRKFNLQYDANQRLTALVLPSVEHAAVVDGWPDNRFPYGTAYVFGYDENGRIHRVFYPDQCAPFVRADRKVDVQGLLKSGTVEARHKVVYDAEGRVANESVGYGTYRYEYSADSQNPNRIQTTKVTDRNGNEQVFRFNEQGLTEEHTVKSNREKNSLQSKQYVTKTEYGLLNQPAKITLPRGNTIEYAYNTGETTSGFADDIDYRHRGALGAVTRRSSDGLQQLVEISLHEPLFNQPMAAVEPRGNPIHPNGTRFKPQNGGVASPSRYATSILYDYFQNRRGTIENDPGLHDLLYPGLPAADAASRIRGTIARSRVRLRAEKLEADDFLPDVGLGDLNGDGQGDGGVGRGPVAPMRGSVCRVVYPEIAHEPESLGRRFEVLTHNLRGQLTTRTDPEGNVRAVVRHPANRPDGVAGSSAADGNKQYGFIRSIHRDVDPGGVMGLVGADARGDLSSFRLMVSRNSNLQPNLQGAHQNLVTRFPTLDGLGNPLQIVDPMGHSTAIHRTELGEPYRIVGPAPYAYMTEIFYSPNRNLIRHDVKDVVAHTGDDDQPKLEGTGSTRNFATTDGPGGKFRELWYVSRYTYDLVDNLVSERVEARGSSPDVLETVYRYDDNQNLVLAVLPRGNTIELDYDERNLLILERVGNRASVELHNDGQVKSLVRRPGDRASDFGYAYDANGNLTHELGAMGRLDASAPATLEVGHAFGGVRPLKLDLRDTYRHVYDGFDRRIVTEDPIGNLERYEYDPGSRLISVAAHEGSGKQRPPVRLAQFHARFDEGGRLYEEQQDVFLGTNVKPPVGAAIEQRSGGLVPIHLSNSAVYQDPADLSAGQQGYVLTRTVFDRAGRPFQVHDDNQAVTILQYDGVGRAIRISDPMGNKADSTHDANGNVVRVLSTEYAEGAGGAAAAETFESRAWYDVMNRPTASATRGANGRPLSADLDVLLPHAIVLRQAYDSRSNLTHAVGPRHNTAHVVYDAASRPIETHLKLRADGVGTGALQDTITHKTAYDANGNQTALTDPNGHVSKFWYDAQDRLATMNYPEERNGPSRFWFYNKASDVWHSGDPNRTFLDYEYDALGRLREVRLDATGRQESKAKLLKPPGTQALLQRFTYDGLSRLIRAEDHSAAGSEASGVTTDFVYAGDQCVEERRVAPAPGSSAPGSSAAAPGSVAPSSDYPVRQYVWGDYVDELVQQRNYDATTDADGSPGVATHDLYPLHDLHHSAAALTERSGAIVEAYDVDAYGQTMIYRGPGADGQWFTDDDERWVFDSGLFVPAGAASEAARRLSLDPLCNHIYQGRYYDPETGLYQFRQRYYHPELGRFLTRDPIGYAGGLNLYAFEGAMPMEAVDPEGEFAWVPFLIGLGVLAVIGLVGGVAFSAARQGLAYAEYQLGWRDDFRFSWGDLFASGVIGAAGAVAVGLFPPIAIAFIGMGLFSGVSELSQGHYLTGAFDIGLSALPLKSPRFRSWMKSETAAFGIAATGNVRGVSRSQMIGRYLARNAQELPQRPLARPSRSHLHPLDSRSEQHIFASDGWGRGGHYWFGSLISIAHGITGKKSMFPIHWTPSRVIRAITKVDADPIAMKQSGGILGTGLNRRGTPADFVGDKIIGGRVIFVLRRLGRIHTRFLIDSK